MKKFIEMYPVVVSAEPVNPSLTIRHIINLFSDKNHCPCDLEVKSLAKAHDMYEEDVENMIFRLLHSLIAFGASNENGYTSKSIEYECDKEQLEMGIEVEYEHTVNYHIAKKIAKDHLAEIPDYYDRLERMERSARIELGLPMEDER